MAYRWQRGSEYSGYSRNDTEPPLGTSLHVDSRHIVLPCFLSRVLRDPLHTTLRRGIPSRIKATAISRIHSRVAFGDWHWIVSLYSFSIDLPSTSGWGSIAGCWNHIWSSSYQRIFWS